MGSRVVTDSFAAVAAGGKKFVLVIANESFYLSLGTANADNYPEGEYQFKIPINAEIIYYLGDTSNDNINVYTTSEDFMFSKGGAESYKIETKIKEDVSTGYAENTIQDVDVDGFSFTPKAVLSFLIHIWVSNNNENAVMSEVGYGDGNLIYCRSASFPGSPVWQLLGFGSTGVMSNTPGIIKLTPGASKIIARISFPDSTQNVNWYYRMTCTACKGA